MQKIYLLLVLAAMLFSPVRAQVISRAASDSISQALVRQYGSLTTLQRVGVVRQQMEEAVMDERLRQIPLLLGYLARTVPDSVPTVQPREAMSLLLAAGEYDLLLTRVAADKTDQQKQWYQKWALLPPYTLADIADFYLAEHIGPLAARTQNLAAEEGAFVRILLEVLPRGGLSPEDDTTVQRFRQRYPNSSYGYVLRGFQEQEKVKMSLRAWHERQAREFYSFHGTTPVDGAEYKLSRFRYGLDFHSGTGFFTSGLNQAFRPLFNFGHGFEFGWDRYMLYLRNYIGTAETRAPYTYDGRTWPTGLRLNYYVPEISLGFRVVESKRLLLTPFAGISWL